MAWKGPRSSRISFAALVMGLVAADAGVAQQPPRRLQVAPVPGGRLEFEVRGQGEPVLLIHGVILADLLRPLADQLVQAHYRVIRLHRRGYSGSSPVSDSFNVAQDAADAAALLRFLGITRAHVVGHSSGAIVAIQLAASFPERVQTLVLLDPPLGFARVRSLRPRGGGADSVEAFVLSKGKPDFRERLASALPGALAQGRRDERRFNVVEWTALGRWEFDAGKAKRITTPILYLSQEHAAAVDTARAWWPEMDFVELPGETHMFPFESPAVTARAITGFLVRHRL